MFPTNPELQIKIDRLAHVLRELPIRSLITYEQLTDALGEDVRAGNNRVALLRARAKIEGETGLRFATVKGEGVKKLDGESVAGIGADIRRSIARKARNAAGRLSGLRYNDIDATTQARIDAERSLLGAISATAKADPAKFEAETRTGPVVAAKVFDMMNRAA